MAEYTLKDEYENFSTEDIFDTVMQFARKKEHYLTVSGRAGQVVQNITDDSIIILRDGNKSHSPVITFNEIKEVIDLCRERMINTSNKEYHNLLSNPLNKTSLLSLLCASKILKVV